MVDDPDVLDGIEARELDSKTRKGLGSGRFAWPAGRKLPIHDAAHVRNALSRFNQTQGMSPAEKAAAKARIRRAAKRFGVEVKADLDDMDRGVSTVRAMSVEAMSLNVPDVPGHPNRMPFSGVLVPIDSPSDRAPHGTNGKRIILTRSAAEEALPSLLGMGVDLKDNLDGHSKTKVGVITDAKIEGNSVVIAGFLYCNDFPRSALAVQMNKADLGFSFEAANIAVDSLEDEVLTVKKLSFVGAAILLRDSAAFQQTSLAAAAAKEKIMSEIPEAEAKVLVDDAIAKAMEPVTKALAEIAASQVAQAALIEELKKTPEVRAIEANAAICAAVEPHAKGFESLADAMSNEHIGLHETDGHVVHAKRLAQSLRAAAAMGQIPHSYHDSGSAWAAADPTTKPTTEDDDVIVKDTPEFKELKASADKTADDLKQALDALKQQKEESASMATMLKDMKASIDGLRPSPQRKTMAPEIASILARANLTMPEEEGGTIAIGKIDAALANMPGMDTSQRMYLKTMLSKAGVIGANGQ